MELTLSELAAISGSGLYGDPERKVTGVATLQNASPAQISFLANSRYRKFLQTTAAAAVILAPADRSRFAGNCLVSDNPYLAFARVSEALHPSARPTAEIHASALVHERTVTGSGLTVGAFSYVGDGVVLGNGVVVGPGCILEGDCRIGDNTRIEGNVSIARNVVIGKNCLIHFGAVIGSDGFGLAKDGEHWVKFPQLGGVIIGDNVEVGANTTIDRGSLEDTQIGNGVKLDNQIQIAHNVKIGDHTAIAACVGISGSTEIGKRCTIAGGVGFVGHLAITDDVHITGMSMVAQSIDEPGVYSGIPAEKNRSWRKNIARFQQLDNMARRLVKLEKQRG